MTDVAKIFINGRSQAVRLPAAYRFDAEEVFIHKDEKTGDVILSRKPENWDGFFAILKGTNIPSDFLDEDQQEEVYRDPFSGWEE